MIKVPPYLQPGDQVGIVCTARKIDQEALAVALKQIDKWGWKAVIGRTVGLAAHQFAGTDEERAADFQAMLDNPNIKAIFCARGGYGTIRMIDHLDFSTFEKQPKWVVGFSDVTALHSHIHQNHHIQTLHATMPIVYPKVLQSCLDNIHHFLTGSALRYRFPHHPLNRKGIAKGALIGGNLSLIYSLVASASDIDTKGKILFLEDLDEYLYHIDRMMINLRRSGKLANLAGLVIGGMTDMHDNDTPFGKNALEIIAEHTAAYDYPVAFQFPAGHLIDNQPMIFGRTVTLRVNTPHAVLDF